MSHDPAWRVIPNLLLSPSPSLFGPSPRPPSPLFLNDESKQGLSALTDSSSSSSSSSSLRSASGVSSARDVDSGRASTTTMTATSVTSVTSATPMTLVAAASAEAATTTSSMSRAMISPSLLSSSPLLSSSSSSLTSSTAASSEITSRSRSRTSQEEKIVFEYNGVSIQAWQLQHWERLIYNESLICILCNRFKNRPVMVMSLDEPSNMCSHSFCLPCISIFLTKDDECHKCHKCPYPECRRTYASNLRSLDDVNTCTILSQVMVACGGGGGGGGSGGRSTGCMFVGSLYSVETYLHMAQCMILEQCGTCHEMVDKVTLRSGEHERDECTHALVTCTKRLYPSSSALYGSHHLMTCGFQCPRYRLEEHQTKECEGRPASCQFARTCLDRGLALADEDAVRIAGNTTTSASAATASASTTGDDSSSRSSSSSTLSREDHQRGLLRYCPRVQTARELHEHNIAALGHHTKMIKILERACERVIEFDHVIHGAPCIQVKQILSIIWKFTLHLGGRGGGGGGSAGDYKKDNMTLSMEPFPLDESTGRLQGTMMLEFCNRGTLCCDMVFERRSPREHMASQQREEQKEQKEAFNSYVFHLPAVILPESGKFTLTMRLVKGFDMDRFIHNDAYLMVEHLTPETREVELSPLIFGSRGE